MSTTLQTPRSGFAVIAAVGPGDVELSRLRDLLDSLYTYEPGVRAIIVIDDRNDGFDLRSAAPAPPTCQTLIVKNPRQGRGDGVRGGLAAGILAGFARADALTDIAFTLKLDTDALVIAPFADRILAAFAANPKLGAVGRYGPASNWAAIVERLGRPWSLTSRDGQPARPNPMALIGRRAKMRRHITEALAAGYQPGWHCQGGAYAISIPALRRIAEMGRFDDPTLWLYSGISEDIMMSMYVRTAGFDLCSLIQDGEPFGVLHLGLPDTPDRLLARGFGIIHSVKDYESFKEKETRAFFAAQREQMKKNVRDPL